VNQMKVFISHSKKDRELALKIAEDLQKNSIEIWIDEWEIFVGDTIIKKLQEGINQCKFMVILVTKNSNSSNWVEKEWQTILQEEIINNQVKLLPVKGDNCEIPVFLRGKKYADFTFDYKFGIETLLTTLNFYKSDMTIPKLNKPDKIKSSVELKLSKSIDEFDYLEQQKLLNAVKELLGTSSDIIITNIRAGSVIVKIELTEEQQIILFKQRNKVAEKIEGFDDAWKIEDKENLYHEKEDIILSVNRETETNYSQFKPEILLSKRLQLISIKGISTPENTTEFYEPVINWIRSKNIYSDYRVVINLEYYNTASAKMLYIILESLKKIEDDGFEIKLEWIVEHDDEYMIEEAEEIQSRIKFRNFKLIEKER
ncbi:SiaC family regulatory phosphoprotein, partial [Bacteroidota bacterium]